MEQIIGVLLLGGSIYVLVTLHNDARAQGWSRMTRAALYATAGTVIALSALIALGSTRAAQVLFVGIGAVLVAIMLLIGALALVAGIVALHDRHRNSGNTPKR